MLINALALRQLEAQDVLSCMLPEDPTRTDGERLFD